MTLRLRICAALLPVALVVAGCSAKRGGQQATAAGCEASTETLAADATMDGGTGEYAVTLVATRGEKSGDRTSGQLRLLEQTGELREYAAPGVDTDARVSVPLYGATGLDLDVVGAVAAGDLSSLDPERPGVMVMESRGEREGAERTMILLRFGSESNRRDVIAFDGAYMVMGVRAISGEGFAGEWRSGVFGREVRGYFCAVRTGDARQ